MKFLGSIAVLLFGVYTTHAQETAWPRAFTTEGGYTINIFQPQAESLEGNVLKSRAAFSVMAPGKDDPMYGVMWAEANLLTNRDNRTYALESVIVTEVRLPEVTDPVLIEGFKTAVEIEVPKWNIEGSLEELLAGLEQSKGEQTQSDKLNTAPPKILYADKPTILILIDGEPKLVEDKDLDVKRVINSPNLLVNPASGQFFLYGGGFWYQASKATGPYTYISKLPKSLKKVDKMVKEKEAEDQSEEVAKMDTPPAITISTVPAEIIVIKGKPEMATVEGTGLLYVSNTENELFLEVKTQDYFVLLSGRWYRSKSVEGPWSYVASDKLPDDFAMIPEGSDKDAVLVSVAGTRAAEEAALDAQVPQTAKVDRKTAKADVEYDGQPKFESIESTDMQYAVNTSSSVIKSGNKYYTVEDGIWFVSSNPGGPWTVSLERPRGVENIPPNNPMYNTKYVYIYDVTPEYVYVGYTPGYMGTYVYGPTIVYGTGYYYNPWRGNWYYPRPCTWGFNMNYNPWTGWSFGFSYGYGWYRPWYWGGGWYGGHYGGWYGPPHYHPPYWGYHNHPHYGPRGGGAYVSHRNINAGRTNNIYNNRKDVITKDRPIPGTKPGRQPAPKPSTKPAAPGGQPTQKPSTRPTTPGEQPTQKPSTRPTTPGGQPTQKPSTRPTEPTQQPSTRPATPGRVYSDPSGKVYQRDDASGSWQTREQNQWKPAPSQQSQNMDRNYQNYNRSNTRQQNFQGTNQGAGMGRSYSPSGGGARSAPRAAPRGRGR